MGVKMNFEIEKAWMVRDDGGSLTVSVIFTVTVMILKKRFVPPNVFIFTQKMKENFLKPTVLRCQNTEIPSGQFY